ncbi:hypothetical protein [Flexibacterium corallicola]|uniref:hypothetical protein n=1 Tax=Flexibacterium corallicola TaxID=3037259 RepID=UPI0038620A33
MAPNFAYQLCCDQISEEQRFGLDLSSLRFALNAAESVQLTTMETFSSIFCTNGFRASVFCPAYGLAESVLLATARQPWKYKGSGDHATEECFQSYPGTAFEQRAGGQTGGGGVRAGAGHAATLYRGSG